MATTISPDHGPKSAPKSEDEAKDSLQGVVRYVLETEPSGEEVIKAKWISDRALPGGRTGSGRAVRQSKDKRIGFEGEWRIEYYEADGSLAWFPFIVMLSKLNEIYHGKWTTTDGVPLLEGFGFEEEGKLIMRYGSPLK